MAIPSPTEPIDSIHAGEKSEERPESALAVTKALKAISALEHADERTAAIGMAKGEDRGTPIQPGNEDAEALRDCECLSLWN